MKIAIAIPTLGGIKTATASSLFALLKVFPHDYTVIFKEGGLISHARIQLVQSAIKLGCTHIFFLDSDMFFEKDSLTRLLDRKVDIVGAHYNLRQHPLTSTVKMDPDKKKNLARDNPNGFVTCDALATGFLLINLDVFRKMPEPWFIFEFDSKGEITCGEDYYFCRRAKEAGYDLWVDLTIPVKHVGNYLY